MHTCLTYYATFNRKTSGESQIDPPCGFSKNVSSKERLKPWFFVTFNIILMDIFPENFLGLVRVRRKTLFSETILAKIYETNFSLSVK